MRNNSKRIVTVIALYMYQHEGVWYYWYVMDYMGLVSVKFEFKILRFSITETTDKKHSIRVVTTTRVNYITLPDWNPVGGYRHYKTIYKLYRNSSNSTSGGTVVDTKEYNNDTSAGLSVSGSYTFNLNSIPINYYFYVSAEIQFKNNSGTIKSKTAITTVYRKENNTPPPPPPPSPGKPNYSAPSVRINKNRYVASATFGNGVDGYGMYNLTVELSGGRGYRVDRTEWYHVLVASAYNNGSPVADNTATKNDSGNSCSGTVYSTASVIHPKTFNSWKVSFYTRVVVYVSPISGYVGSPTTAADSINVDDNG